MRNYIGHWIQFALGNMKKNKYTALNQNPGHVVLPETPFCQILILWAEFEWEQIEI